MRFMYIAYLRIIFYLKFDDRSLLISSASLGFCSIFQRDCWIHIYMCTVGLWIMLLMYLCFQKCDFSKAICIVVGTWSRLSREMTGNSFLRNVYIFELKLIRYSCIVFFICQTHGELFDNIHWMSGHINICSILYLVSKVSRQFKSKLSVNNTSPVYRYGYVQFNEIIVVSIE